MRLLLGLLVLMRPHQWLKNSFVFAGLVFAQRWQEGVLLWQVLGAFAAFCCCSSAVYIINDIHDRISDASHPHKRHRPLVRNAVPVHVARALSATLLGASTWLAWGHATLLLLLGIYLVVNLAYTWRLKTVPVVDVFSIACGFMLRLLAGTLAVGIAPSHWLLLTGLFVALFLGFAKRKAESFHAQAARRAVLQAYPPALLDTLMTCTLTATMITYSLFATTASALVEHGSQLVYTVPVVIFGLLRYTYQVHQGRGQGEDVARDLLRDPWVWATLGVWLLIFFGP